MPRTKSQTIPTTTASASRRWSREARRHHRGRVTRRSVPPTARSSRSATRSSFAVAASRASPGHGAGSPSAARSARLRVAVATCACWTSVGGGTEVRPGSGVPLGSAVAEAEPPKRVGPQPANPADERPAGRKRPAVPVRGVDRPDDPRDAAGLLERRNEPLAVCGWTRRPSRRRTTRQRSSGRGDVRSEPGDRSVACRDPVGEQAAQRIEPLARPRRDDEHRHRRQAVVCQEPETSWRQSSISPGDRRSAWFRTTAIAAPCVCSGRR